MNNLSAIKTAASDSGAHDYIRSFESFYQTRLYGYDEESTSNMPFDYTYYDDPDSNRTTPFMAKMLEDNILHQAKYNDKRILWGPKPNDKGINIKIPDHVPSKVEEDVDGRPLSGGQWQRIALARAFMKIKEADLLILDEPSSALDPQAEYEVFKSIMELRKNKTTIYIV
jgi:predicted ATPase